MAKRKKSKTRKQLAMGLQTANTLLKNRTPIVAIMSMFSLLVQLGCDPLGLFPPAAQQAIQQVGNELQQFNQQNSGVPGSGSSGVVGSWGQAINQWSQAQAGSGAAQTWQQAAAQAVQQVQGSWGQPQSSSGSAANPIQQPQFQQTGFATQPVGQIGSVPFDNRALLIASFNIQVFGASKLGKPEVARLLVDIVRRFDLTAIQELRASDQSVLDQFLQMLNQTGGTYRYVVGERLGTSTSKEQYTYVYDAAKLRVTHQPTTVRDPQGVMPRPPLATRFQCIELPEGQGFTFTLLNVHTAPDQAVQELKALESVVAATRQLLPMEDDIIVLGDFNASTSQIAGVRWFPAQTAAIPNEWMTNTRLSKNYDNLVFDGRATVEYTGRSGVFAYQQLYQLSLDQALEVSDHCPVWGEFSIFENRGASLAGGYPGSGSR
ncbi:MAG: endonuclease/exonuclease/phosphatase family protein [Planctomycetota bacterium]|jgi:deoxyribonuclease-1-like protein